MKSRFAAALMIAVVGVTAHASAVADEPVPGANLQELLALARASNPDYASMRLEAQAAAERVEPAGALPDPKLRTELMDITKMGEQNPTIWPASVGSTRYTLMQELPWFGKRDLKRELAHWDAAGSEGRSKASWTELAAKIKATQAQRFYLHSNEKLTLEILDLMVRLEKIAHARYATGSAAQQDVIRAQIEQTSMRKELVALAGERMQTDIRLNALLARPASAPLARPVADYTVPTANELRSAGLEELLRERNPQLFSEQARVHSAEKNRDLAYKNRYPDFTVSVSPTQVQSAVTEWSLMLELNIPLQQSSRRAQEREAQAMLAAAQLRQQASANQLLSDLAENLAAIEAAQRSEALATHSLLPQAELTFSAALGGYENGKLDFATLLDAQRQIRQARQSQIKAQWDAQMRLAEIEKLIGKDL